MKDVVVLDEAPVETSLLGETKSFSIKADGKAFKILIDGLYSDKPRAIVRELWSNAWDSHVSAGIADRPFKVVLPTKWDETFSVRDYGIGMTHDEVMSLHDRVHVDQGRHQRRGRQVWPGVQDPIRLHRQLCGPGRSGWREAPL